MKISCVGGGPAGLLFAILMKQRDQDSEITVFERDPVGHTYGWGVTTSKRLLADLGGSDPQTARAISASAFRWEDEIVCVQGRQTAHLGGSGSSIGRQRLLDIFAKRAIDLGVHVHFEREIEDIDRLVDSDLIVVCDGVNSRIRRLHADQFKTTIKVGRNRYLWLGTSKVFDVFTYSFVQTDAGWIWFGGYSFTSDLSACIVECSPETWTGLGFDKLGRNETISLLEKIFKRDLGGHPLMGQVRDPQVVPWLNFREVTNEKWHHDNLVLMGDAAHTTHYTIGWGTELAIKDAIVLAEMLDKHGDVQLALAAYTRERQAALLRRQTEARSSGRWFENIPRYINLEVPQFATLLRARRSRLLAHTPPLGYYYLYQVGRTLTKPQALRRLRRLQI